MTSRSAIRKTKIVATIGPACDDVATLTRMIAAGMSVARLNLSHGDVDEHTARLQRVREAAAGLDANIAVMVDTRGIEIRTGRLSQDSITLRSGERFSLHTQPGYGDDKGVSVSYQRLAEEVRRGAPVLIDDGAIELEVESSDGETLICRVVHGGILRSRKSVNVPDSRLSISSVSQERRDEVLRELRFAVDNDVEYIAASFIQTADELHRMREMLSEQGRVIPIIAKIENKIGVENLETIVDAADGLMVARGDLGVELPLAEVPGTQKRMIHMTVSRGKPVITATQMLATMEHNPKPTRAEASDVANAILDGTSAVMLSGETAVGKYPVQAVATMAELALRAEAHLAEYGYLQRIQQGTSDTVTEAVAQAAVAMAHQLQASAIVSLTETGSSPRLVSKHRPHCPILAITASVPVARRLAMNWGVVPVLYSGARTDEARIGFAIDWARKRNILDTGDVIVSTAGYAQKAGGTDLLRVITLAQQS